MQVRVRVFGHIIIEYDIDAFNIHATTEQIRRNQNALKII